MAIMYEFKPDQTETNDVNRVILKKIVQPEKKVVKEISVNKLQGYLADLVARRDAMNANIADLEAEITKIMADLKIVITEDIQDEPILGEIK